MDISRLRVVLALLLLFAIGAGIFTYVRYKRFSEYLISRIDSQAGKRLGRQIKFAGISFSPLKGVVVEKPCVSRKPDFSKGAFFCADRLIIRPELSRLMRNRLYFSNIELEKPVIKLREAAGKWDFTDLLELLPRTSKSLYVTWNAKRLVLRGSDIQLDIGSSGRSVSLENADIELLHYSSLAGNFALTARAAAKTILNGQLLSADVFLKTDLNFEYAGLTSAFGELRLESASLGAATLKNAGLKWELFNIDKPLPEKNYSLGLKAERLMVPAQSGSVTRSVNNAMNVLSSVIGRATPRVEDIEMAELAAELTLNDGILRIKRLYMNADLIGMNASYELNGPASTVDIDLTANIGERKMRLTAKGPMNKPAISPEMSVTLNRKLLEGVNAVNTAVLSIFPVTMEAR